jgi:hypothetical protein
VYRLKRHWWIGSERYKRKELADFLGQPRLDRDENTPIIALVEDKIAIGGVQSGANDGRCRRIPKCPRMGVLDPQNGGDSLRSSDELLKETTR